MTATDTQAMTLTENEERVRRLLDRDWNFLVGGLFIEPTFLTADPSMRVANEEIFGPVASVLRWTDPDEAIRIANSVDYGLTGSVFTRDLTTALNTARALDTGYGWVNNAGPHYLGLPYGGWEGSGTGHEESIEELFSYSQVKSVSVML